MNLQHRIDLLARLGEYILSDDPQWKEAKEKAGHENGWFIPEFIELSVKNIAGAFLQKNILEKWVAGYKLTNTNAKTVGLVMAGNIPLVGFHDWLAVFISGNKALIKPSSKDEALIKHLVAQLTAWNEDVKEYTRFPGMLKGCDAYIATGSNNSSRYFDYYFGKYPHIIRRNKTSVAILTGDETQQELEYLADDVYLYFGLGCRNVTKIYTTREYDFVPLLEAFRKYNYLGDHFKYKNNYDYNLALHLLNKKYYMTNGSILLIEDAALFSPISQLNYEFYNDIKELTTSLKNREELQCIVGRGYIPFGQAQYPAITDYADGTDTLEFLSRL
jgi:Acyl-CoA reductase (LuxC)